MHEPDPNPRTGKSGPRVIWLVLGGIGVIGILLALFGGFPADIDTEDALAQSLYYVLLLVLVGSSAVLHRGMKLTSVFRNILIWLAIAATLVLGYSYRYEFSGASDRIQAELFPRDGVTRGDSISFAASQNNHFIVAALVDGIEVEFLVDTGASDIVLSPRDAVRVGFDPDRLDYTREYATANGTVLAAPVRLRSIEIGPILLQDMPASVNDADMARSLLGVRFLDELSSYEVSQGRLTFYR